MGRKMMICVASHLKIQICLLMVALSIPALVGVVAVVGVVAEGPGAADDGVKIMNSVCLWRIYKIIQL